MTIQHKRGSELKVGDTIVVWWAPKRDQITRLSPYIGVYQNTICKGARVASFALLGTGMTIFPDEDFEVIT